MSDQATRWILEESREELEYPWTGHKEPIGSVCLAREAGCWWDFSVRDMTGGYRRIVSVLTDGVVVCPDIRSVNGSGIVDTADLDTAIIELERFVHLVGIEKAARAIPCVCPKDTYWCCCFKRVVDLKFPHVPTRADIDELKERVATQRIHRRLEREKRDTETVETQDSFTQSQFEEATLRYRAACIDNTTVCMRDVTHTSLGVHGWLEMRP
jgi:hypothetical protein